MYPFKEESLNYDKALTTKHPKIDPIATAHNAKQTAINMTFDEVKDVHGFVTDVFKDRGNENAYVLKPTFLNPRIHKQLAKDYSEGCTLM